MAKSIQVAVQASLTNTKEIIAQIREALNTGLASLDKKGLGFLDNISKKLGQATELFDQGSLNQARKMVQEINNSMYSIYRALRVEAGAASDDLDKLSAKLEELKKQKALKELQDPNLRYRQRKDGTVVYTKDGLTDEQKAKIGGSTERGVFRGGAVEISYGGKNSSMYGIANAIAARLREEEKKGEGKDTDLITELKEALKSIGFEPTDKGVKFVNLTEEYNKAVKEFETQIEQLNIAIEKAKKEFDEEDANIEHIKVAADGQSFDITPLQSRTSQNIKDLDDALEEQNRLQKEAAEATKKKNDADEEAAIRQIDLKNAIKEETVAQTNQTGAVTKAVTTFFGYQMVIRQLRRLWREAIHTITELDKQLTTQAMVTGMTREETWQLVTAYQEIATATGLAQTTIAGVTTEYLRQGESLQNALTLTKAAAAAATVAGISASDSVKYLTTAIHGFKLEAEDALAVSDKFAALAATAATNYEDLAVALSKVASQAALAGMSMDYTLALLTAGLDVTQEAPESIGTALKTVIARMREISDYGKTLEDDVDLNQVESGLRAVGIELRNGVGELRSTEDVLDELGQKWATLSANQQAAVAKALAGTRQQSRLVAIMENYDKVLEYQNTAMNSIGATTAQQVTYLQGMEAATNRLQSTYQGLINSIITSNEAITAVNALQGVLEWVGNFLKQPAGRWALLSTLATMLLKSKELVTRIKNTVDQLVASLSNARKEEQTIVQLREKELEQVKQSMLGKNLTSGSSRPNGWLSNNTSKAGIADILAQLGRFTKSLMTPGIGYGARIQQNGRNIRSTVSEWWQHNSLVGKIRGVTADRRTVKNTKNNTTAELAKAEIELQKARQNTKEATEAVIEAEEAYDPDEGVGNADLERKQQAETAAKQKQVELEEKVTALKNRELVLSSSQLSTAEKIEYLAREEWLTKNKSKIEELERMQLAGESLDTEQLRTLETAKQYRNEQAKTINSSQQSLGQKLSGTMSKVTGAVAAASTVIAWIQEWKDIFDNFANDLAATALEESKRIQSEMYQNTQLKSTIASSTATITKLSRQVVKTTEDLENLSEAQTEFADALGLSKEEVAAMTTEQVENLAQAKQLALDEKNTKLAEELNDTLTKASYNRNGWEIAGNILGKTAAGAGAGTMVNAGWGTLIGAVAGLLVGAGEEITKAVIAADARNKINALLETDEGVEQFKYALKLNYKNIAQATEEGGKEMAAAMSAMFSSIVELFDANDLKAILERFNYDMGAFATYFNQLLGDNIDAVKILSSDKSTIGQRVTAAQQINAATANDKELNDAFKKINSNYLTIGNSLTTAQIELADAQQWTLSSVSAVINAFGTDIQGLQQAFNGLDVWLQNGAQKTGQLAAVVAELTDEELEAIKQMITGGRSLQDVAEANTRNRNQVNSFRETQANWNNMSESEQQQFINDNITFFSDPEALKKFFNGEDITAELRTYQAEIQVESRKMYEEQRKAAILDLENAQKKGDEKLIAEAQAYLSIIENRLEGVDHMFDLSLSEIVEKQNEQLEKIKEMYQAEEQALTESLNKRKEAYQKYFDSLASQEAAADYTQNRDQLIESISRLSGGTDATSRNKVADLRKQLDQIEKEEAKRKTEEARQAVLQNIDDQVTAIEERFDKLLNNNQELLASMDENTEAQYLNYLATLNLTGEDLQLRTQELSDLLQGIWTREGRKGFNDVSVAATQVPQSPTTEQDPQSIMNLSIGNQTEKVTLKQSDMQELLKQMFTWLNDHAGTHFIV